jgi:hexosaminidase
MLLDVARQVYETKDLLRVLDLLAWHNSRADVAQLTGRAEQPFITIVPEIDIPGHSYSILQSIPELRDPSETGSYRSIQNSPKNVLNPAVRKT